MIGILLIGLIGQQIYGQDWTPINSGTTKKLNKIVFVNDNLGFIVGEDGTILKTSNGGASYQPINSGVQHELYDISFANDSVGFINGLKTIDGGITWTGQPTTQGYGWIDALDEYNLFGSWYGSFFGAIYKSTDGGNFWTANTNSPIEHGMMFGDSHFFDLQEGYVVSWYSGKLIKTTDGGVTWNDITSVNPERTNYYGVSFPTKRTGIVVGGFGTFRKTTDEGITWSSIFPANAPLTFDAFSVYTKSVDDYIIVGGSNLNEKKIYRTSDGGVSWISSNLSDHSLYDVTCNSIACYAVGANGTILTNAINSNTIDVDNKINKIKAYPNPSSDYLTIDLNDFNKAEFAIFDVYGRSFPLKVNQDKTIDIRFLPVGFYILEAIVDGRVNAVKFIKE